MVARGDGSVALFLEMSEMNGKHAPPTGDLHGRPWVGRIKADKSAPTDGRISLFMCIIGVYGCLD